MTRITRKPGAVALVNAKLATLKREERIIRGRGYYLLTGGVSSRMHESGLYGWSFPIAPEHKARLWMDVKMKIAEVDPLIDMDEVAAISDDKFWEDK